MSEQVKKSFVPLIYFALAASVLLVFWQVRNFEFINYDDNSYITENQHFSNGLNGDSVIWAFTTPHIGNWLPLTWLSFMLDSQLFGLDSGRMHLVNLLLHIVNTLLLFAVLKRMTGSLWRSAFVAAAFALHPMHVESVAWVIERKDVLSTFFFMLTAAAYVGYVRGGGFFRYLLTILLFILGLLAKPMLVTLPFVLLLLDYWPLERFTSRQAAKSAGKLIIEKIPFFLLSCVFSVITFLAQKGSGSVAGIDTLPLTYRIANSFLSYARYIGKMLWPENLSIFYPPDIIRIPIWEILLSFLLVIAVTIFVVYFSRKFKYLAVGWFWFVLTLIPVIGIVQSGAQSYADRYTYIPYIGLFIIIAWGLPELLPVCPYRNIILGMAAVIVITALGTVAFRQTNYWKDSFALFTHSIEVTKNNYIAYNNLGVACGSLGRYQDAIEFCKQAIKIKPDYVDAHNNLGAAYSGLGRYQDAIESCKQAIKIRPDYVDAHNNLGAAYNSLGRYQDAIESCKQAIKIKPDYAEAHNNLGVAYGSLGRYQDAIESCKQAIKINPHYVDAHCNLGVAYLMAGDKDSALEECKILKTLDAEKANELFKLINK